MVKLFFRIRWILSHYSFLHMILYPVYRFIGVIYSSQIPLKTQIGRSPKFTHVLYGIFIAGGAKIGDNVTIYHHVTIGGVNTEYSKNKGSPEIGDNCQIRLNVVAWYDILDNTMVVFDKQSFRFIGRNNA